MPLLYFGGSFNPIHHGHLICARAAAEAGGFDRVVLVPSAQPPHKPHFADMAAAVDRLAMCRLAVNGSPGFEIDQIELNRAGPSYTIDTVDELNRSAGAPVHWLIGADMLLYLPNWHRAEELIERVRFVVMARQGWTLDWNTLPEHFRFLQNHVVPAPMIDISASDIRRRVAVGKSIAFLTPPPVVAHIERRQLYRPSPGDE